MVSGQCRLCIFPTLCNSGSFPSPEVLRKSLEGRVSKQDFVVKKERKPVVIQPNQVLGKHLTALKGMEMQA